MDFTTANTNGGIIADVACLAIIAIFAIVNYKKGLMAQIFKVVCSLGALAIAYFFSNTLTDFLSQNFNFDDLLSEKLRGIFGQGAAFLAELTEENLIAAISQLNLPDFIAELALSSINTGSFANIGNYLANLLAHYVIVVLSFIALLIISKILLTLVSKLLIKIVKLPILRGIDGFLGLLWGLVKASLLIFALLFIIEIIPGDGLIEAKKAIDSSIVASFLREYNAITYAINWITTKLNF